MKYWYFILFFTFLGNSAPAQLLQENDFSAIKDYDTKIEALKKQCNLLIGYNPDVPENFQEAARYGQLGMWYAKKDDHKSKALFSLITGVSYYNLLLFDSAQYYFHLGADESLKSGSSYYITWANGALLTLYMQKQQLQQAETYKNIIQAVVDTTKEVTALSKGYYGLGTYYYYKSYYATSQEYLLKGLDAAQKLLDTTIDNRLKKEYAINAYLLYKIYYNTKLYKEGINALRRGSQYINLSQTLKIRYYAAFIDAYTIDNAFGNIDTALKYYHALLGVPAQPQKGIPSEAVTSTLNIGQYYMNNGQLDKAKPFILRGDSLASVSKSPFLIHQVQNVMGRFEYFSGHYDEAIRLLSQSAIVSKNMTKGNYIECLVYIARSYKAKGDLAKAISYYELVDVQKDSLNAEVLSRNIADLEIQHRTREKEGEIISLSNSNKVRALELKSAARLRLLLIAGLIGLAIISLLLYKFYRNKEKLNKALNERNEELDTLNAKLAIANESKAKLFGIFSHDLRSPLSKIAQFLRLQKENPDLFNDNAREEYHEKFTHSTANLLNTMEDLLIWSKSQMENFVPEYQSISVNSLIQKEIDLLNNQIEEKVLTIENHIPDTFIAHTDENFMSIILRNLLQNAVRYSNKGEIISLEAEENAISITNSSGTGLDASALNTLLQNEEISSNNWGLGLQIVKDLAQRIGITIFFQGRGTHFVKAYLKWDNR